MKSMKLTACLVSMLLMLELFLAFDALAQEPTTEPPEAEPHVEIGALGLANPPPAGFSILYIFTGANNDTTGSEQIATAIHCTNIDTQAVTLRLEFFSSGGGTVVSFNDSLASNETEIYSTQPTFFDGTVLPGAVEPNGNNNHFAKGSGRILSNSPKLICTAQLLEPDTSVPTFMVKLPLFDAAGNPVGGSGTVYLPVILKGS